MSHFDAHTGRAGYCSEVLKLGLENVLKVYAYSYRIDAYTLGFYMALNLPANIIGFCIYES